MDKLHFLRPLLFNQQNNFDCILERLLKENYKNVRYNCYMAAQDCELSNRELRRYCMRRFKFGFKDLLKIYRLTVAAKLLLIGKTQLYCSYETGFTSVSYFGFCFKKITHLTPKEYVANNLKLSLTKKHGHLETIKTYLENHFCNPNINSKDLAKHLNFGDRKLRIVFFGYYSMGFLQHLRELRLTYAQSLLKGDIGITRIAMDIGFSSSSYFSYCFKSRFNISPLEYSKQYTKI